ncbi:hematopoietic SH2 domain-containing protein homolog [Notolabrus celidotus]|uniref:hematopoietic SH2 domain-containing protein homolog n=1 Tax=Notolabrus celidotus TaxID=1203425 RepID=UPI0014903586|nr:hematopoietic SH2 domain-containing protein homolog [Notolabrus celidotus]
MMEWSPPLQGQHEAYIWFTESQLSSVIRNGVVPEWFHGIISRKTAEELLMSKPPGYFLIRVSESRIGYTLSYRAEDRCRHFMVDALEYGLYIIKGETRHHRCLQDLVDFHRRTPIMPFNEVLTVACGQSSDDKTDYAELLFPQRHLNLDTNLQQNESLHASINSPVSQDDDPPALPCRPNNLKTPTAFSQGRLYPSLEEEFPQDIPHFPTTPVPMIRNKQPPELPVRSSHPPLKQNQACVRTVSAPDSRFTHTATEHPVSTHSNQQAKPSVVSNLKNFKKKFQKKRSPSQELMNADTNVEETEKSGTTENEYQEITEEQPFTSKPFSHTSPDVKLTHGGLPQEYRQPSPFAPGY